MRMTVTSEQKWILGALGAAILAAVPSFFMGKSSAPAAVQAQTSMETIKPKGGAAPILESSWSPRAMSGDEQRALKETLKIDLNHADADELGTLPNVGPSTAQRIIDYREEHGCFRDIEELREVKGFGGAKFDAAKDVIRLDMTGCVFKSGGGGAAEDQSSKKKSGKASKKSGGPDKLVNINTADAEELDALPGIGKASAQRIIDYRNDNGPFHSIDDIMNVQGIKEGTFEKIKDLITTR